MKFRQRHHRDTGRQSQASGRTYPTPRPPSNDQCATGFMDCNFQDVYGIVTWEQSQELGTSPSELTIHSPNFYSPGVVNGLALSTTPDDFPADILEFPVEEVEAEGDGVVTVSVSTAFHPTAHPQLPPADIIFSCSDGVVFYAHSKTILDTCGTAFKAFLGGPLEGQKFGDILISVTSTSAELNIVLHMLYGMSSVSYSPTFETLANAVDSMPSYSIPPAKHILPGTQLFNQLLAYAALQPLNVYALAGHHNIHPLAVSTSSHLLSYYLQTITDSQAIRMGAIYLLKLMALHVDRFNALKAVLLKPPHLHPQTRECDFGAQKKLTRVWSLVSAHFAWDATPDISAHQMQAALDPLMVQIDCKDCQNSLRDRIKELIVQWTAVRFYYFEKRLPFQVAMRFLRYIEQLGPLRFCLMRQDPSSFYPNYCSLPARPLTKFYLFRLLAHDLTGVRRSYVIPSVSLQ